MKKEMAAFRYPKKYLSEPKIFFFPFWNLFRNIFFKISKWKKSGKYLYFL